MKRIIFSVVLFSFMFFCHSNLFGQAKVNERLSIKPQQVEECDDAKKSAKEQYILATHANVDEDELAARKKSSQSDDANQIKFDKVKSVALPQSTQEDINAQVLALNQTFQSNNQRFRAKVISMKDGSKLIQIVEGKPAASYIEVRSKDKK